MGEFSYLVLYCLLTALVLQIMYVYWPFKTRLRPRRKLVGRHALVRNASITTLTFVIIMTAELSAYQILTSHFPWDTYETTTAPWARGMWDYVNLAIPVIGLFATVTLNAEWPTFTKHRLITSKAVALLVAVAAGFAGSVAVGQANDVYKGSYPEPPALVGFAGRGVASLDVALLVNNGGTTFVSGSVTATVTVTGPPSSDLAFMLLGEGYFAESSFTSDTASVVRRERGSFDYGTPTETSSCKIYPQSEATEWRSWIDVFRPIVGSARTNQDGIARVLIEFTDTRDWYIAHGERAAIHLPRYEVVTPEIGTCLIGRGGYQGTWLRTPHASGSIGLASTRLDVEALIASRLPEDPAVGSGEKIPSYDSSDLFWRDEWDESTSLKSGTLFVVAGYEIKSPQSVARSQSLLFTAALLWGLALAAVFQLLTAPSGIGPIAPTSRRLRRRRIASPRSGRIVRRLANAPRLKVLSRRLVRNLRRLASSRD